LPSLKQENLSLESQTPTPKANGPGKAINKFQKIKIKRKQARNSYEDSESELNSRNYSVHFCRENGSIYSLHTGSIKAKERAEIGCQTEPVAQAHSQTQAQPSQTQATTQTAVELKTSGQQT